MNLINKVNLFYYHIGLVLILLDCAPFIYAPTAGGGQCSLRTIGDHSTKGRNAKEFITAGDCIGPSHTIVGNIAKHWEKGSDYSFGNLDDFCLHTAISNDQNWAESRKRVYRGFGYDDFPILQQLVMKSAWSYQMEESLATANMNWSHPEAEYEKLNEQAQENMKKVEMLEKELERRKKIRIAYVYDFNKAIQEDQDITWDWNMTEGLGENGGPLFDPAKDLKEQPILVYLEKGMNYSRDEFLTNTKKFSTNDKKAFYHHCCERENWEYVRPSAITQGCPRVPPGTDGLDAWDYMHLVVRPMLFNETIDTWEDNFIFYEKFEGRDPKFPQSVNFSWNGDLAKQKKAYDKRREIECKFTTIVEENPEKMDVELRQHTIKWMRYDFMYKKYKTILEQLLEIPDFKTSVDICTATAAQWTSRLHPLKALIDNAKLSQYKPDYLAPNPYFVEVTGVLVKGVPLKNYLHVRVFSNRSVSDDKSRLHTNPKYHNLNERRDRTTGRIKAVLLIVKDQDGFPVGNFDKPIPCENTCRDRNHNQPVHTHSTYRNDLTCSFTPPTANMHPGVFIWPDGPKHIWSKEGVREVHATWHFAQDTCNFVTELHFQALVFEDIDGEYAGTDRFHKQNYQIPLLDCDNNGYIERTFDKDKPNVRISELLERNKNADTPPKPEQYLERYQKEIRNFMGRGHVWGWTAQYNIIAPTYDSVGASDWVNIPRLKYLVDHDSEAINCHAALESNKFGFIKSVAPRNGKDIPNKGKYTLKLMDDFRISLDEVDPQYFGIHYGNKDKDNYHGCRYPKLNSIFKHSINITNSLKTFLGLPTIEEYVKKEPMVRCPCPALPTTPKPEDRTIGPDQIHGRMTHGSHMTLAWMFFIPLAIFTSRYFKETFSNVFCIQEYWWLAFHVFLLLCGMVFMIGANLSVIAKETLLKPADTKEMKAHRILGWASWAIFSFQMISGLFRNKDPSKRFWQIVIHYGAGMLNVTISIMCMGLVGNVGGSCMTCRGVIIYLGWICFNVGIYGMMECHMSAVDEILELDPPRTRCPIPYKRLFGQDAPGRNFRMAVWLGYAVGCLTMWALLSATIWTSEGLSCRDIWQGKSSPIGQFLNQTI